MMRRLLAIPLLVGVLTVSTHAVTISLHSYDNAYTADTIIDGSTHWVYIGAVRLNIAGYTGPQEAWCVDLKQNVSGSAWDAVQKLTLPASLDDGRRADWAMGTLWVNRPAATDALGRAALQLAIWEALYDGYGADPFSSGRFRVGNVFNGTNRNAINSAVLAQAQGFLQAWNGLSVANGTLFDAPLPGSGTRSQDFILTPSGGFVPQAVPEPGTLLLMSFGLLGIGKVMKRR